MTGAIMHPSWCTRPADEAVEGIHVSHAIGCNPEKTEIVAISVRLIQLWPPYHDVPPLLQLTIVEDGTSVSYPLPRAQARVLAHAVMKQLCLAEPSECI